MNAALHAIAEPRRREILGLVRHRELPAGRIASHFTISRPAISQHLRVLHDAGLITERREGTRRLYRVRPEGFAELQAFIESFWDGALARLQLEAESEELRTRGTEGAS